MLENLKTEGKEIEPIVTGKEAMITKRKQQFADKERKDKKKKKKLDDSDSDWMPNRKERLKRMKENSLSEKERENSIEIERVNLIRYNKTVIDEKDLLISGSSSSSSNTTTSSSPIFISSNPSLTPSLLSNPSMVDSQRVVQVSTVLLDDSDLFK
jgi:uncharacterized membrane protein YdbT with pleckstrin-like domain